MKKSNQSILTIVILSTFIFGLIIGLCANHSTKKLALYNEYQDVVEQLLDECDAIHNICDDVCEGDTYAQYVELREELGLE